MYKETLLVYKYPNTIKEINKYFNLPNSNRIIEK